MKVDITGLKSPELKSDERNLVNPMRRLTLEEIELRDQGVDVEGLIHNKDPEQSNAEPKEEILITSIQAETHDSKENELTAGRNIMEETPTHNDGGQGSYMTTFVADPNQMPMLANQMLSTLTAKDIAEIIKAAIKEGNSLSAKGEFENFKTMLKEYYLKEKERILIGREFYVYDLFINGEGKICRTITLPNIDRFKGDKISNCIFPKLEIIKPVGKGAIGLIYKFTTTVDGKEVCTYFDDETLTVESFSRQLTKLGIKFFVAHGSRKAIVNDLLVTLLEQARVSELPVNSGWIKINDCWTWVPFGSKTFKEVRYEYLGR